MRTPRRLDRLSVALKHTQPDLTIVLENIHDPHNVSAILRTCDAVGVRHVSLLYTEEKFPKIGKKSSASASKWVESEKFKSVPDCYGSLRADGFLVAASVVDAKSVSLYELDLRRKTALVFGNEHRGVSGEAASSADVLFQIPMSGMVQSLNVSVACAITLYEALRQRIKSGDFEKQKIGGGEFKKRLEEWLKK
jgi:tRNA (guanosine-2'-O-)-methyltransferase